MSGDRRSVRLRRAARAVAVGCTAALAACDDESISGAFLEEHATIDVVVRTAGREFARGGYRLKVADTPGITTALNDSVTLSVPPGPITLVLRDLPPTCDPVIGTRTFDGSVNWTSTVEGGEHTAVVFDVRCTAKDIVFARMGAGNRHELFRVNTDGSGAVQLTLYAGPFIRSPRWSPSGAWIAYASDALSSTNMELFLLRADGGALVRLCCGPSAGGFDWDVDPTWSPDGAAIAWSAARPDTMLRGIHRIAVDGTDRVQLTVGPDAHPDWGPDGRLLFTRRRGDPPNGGDLWIMGPRGENPTRLVEGVEGGGAWSPDGRTVAFTRLDPDTGLHAIWTVPTAGGEPERRAAQVSETQPRWSPDGTQLVFHYSTDPDAHAATRGICIGSVGDTGCDPLTASTGGSAVDLYPDWRRR